MCDMSSIAPGMSELARIWNTNESAITPHLSQFDIGTTNPFHSQVRHQMFQPSERNSLVSQTPLHPPVSISTQTRENGSEETPELTSHSRQVSQEDTFPSTPDSIPLSHSFTQLLLEAENALQSMDFLTGISAQDPPDGTSADLQKVGLSYGGDVVESCLRVSSGEAPLVTVQPYSRHWKRSGVYQWRKPASVGRPEVVKRDDRRSESRRRRKGVKNGMIQGCKKAALKIPHFHRNTALLDLPNELLSLIFSYLPLSSLLAVSQSCRRLHLLSNSPFLYSHLNMSGMSLSTDNLSWILSKQPKHFNCSKSSVTLTDSQIQLLFQGIAPHLQSLHLYPGSPYTLKGDQVCHLLSQHATHSLSCVKLNWVSVSDYGLSALSSLHSLTVLSLAGANQITDLGIVPLLLRFQNTLRELDLSSCIRLTNRTGSVVATCHYLSSLNLGNCYKFTDRVFKLILSSLQLIEYLDLHSNPGLAETDSSVLEGMDESSKLRSLNLSNANNIKDSHLVHLISKWPNLEQLSVKRCQLTDSFVTALGQARLLRLTHLDLSGLPISSLALSTIASSYQLSLTTLSLNSCLRVTQSCLTKLIEKCKKLETVSVFDTKIYPVPKYLIKSKVKIIGATPLPPTLSRNTIK